MIQYMESKSELYNILAALGAVCTEDQLFQEARSSFNEQFVKQYPISYKDIEHVGYFNPHFRLDIGETGIFEVWVNGEYINNYEITWIQGSVHLYGVLPRQYPEDTVVKVYCNKFAVDRYSVVQDEVGTYTHTYQVNLSDHPFCDMEHPDKAVYYIGDGKVQLPQVVRSGDTMTFTCKYTKSIDMIVCSNLGGIYDLKAGVGTYIDNPYSTRCYLNVIVEDDPDYKLDARFYPCVMADKDCTVRVFTDGSKYVPYPELTRLMTYAEFAHIADPYNCNDKYLNSLKPAASHVWASDDDETILEKFKEIAPYMYRIYEQFPKLCDVEVSDFLILDNTIFGQENFYKRTVKYLDGTSEEAIVCRCPYEDYRDILFYGNYMFGNYRVINAMGVPPFMIESPNGTPTYVITGNYKPELFTLIKFNAAEDTMISNIGDYIDANNLLKLHIKLNRFYRNMLILRGSVLDVGNNAPDTGDMTNVRVSTTEPETKDTHLWFELLVNAEPEKFKTNPNLIIKSFGLDISDIPEELREGVYSLNLPHDGGPEAYTQLLFTYFEMSERHKKHLVVQHQAGDENDPRVAEFDYITHGKTPAGTDDDVNVLHFEGPGEFTKTDEVKEGIDLTPYDDGTHKEGDIYVGSNPGMLYGRDDVSTDTDPGEDDSPSSDFDSLLGGVSLDQNKYSLDTIQYMDPETGRAISGDVIRALPVADKLALVTRYITEGTDEEKEHTKMLWEQYLQSLDEDILDTAVYKVLLTDYAYHEGLAEAIPALPDDFNMQESPFVVQQEEPDDPTTGLYWVQLDSDDPLVIQETIKSNIHYIMSVRQPTKVEIGTYWVNIPAVVLQEYIEEILSVPLMEVGAELPVGEYKKFDDKEDEATTVIDYGAHGKTDGGLEIFDEVKDDSLHPVYYGDEVFAQEPKDGDIWYEFLDEIDNKVCYSDETSMVIRIDERLMLIQFDHDNMTAFAFDDIVLNFKGRLGIRYIAILADLINSGVIDLKDVNIFYRRLITGKDYFDPGLRRLYTGRSYVISTAKIDTDDYSITYSSNIGRYHIDYTDKESVINRERESAYRNVIDYSHREFGFIEDRMLLFVNGRYIPRADFEEIAAGKIQLTNFHELIDHVDILYSKKDESLSKLKKIVVSCWAAPDESVSIKRPKQNRYRHMKPIHVCEKTLMGYYDVLINDFVLTGKIHRMVRYIEAHPEERAQVINEFKRKFHDITDFDLVGMDFEDSRIIIPALGTSFKYDIKEETF